MKKLEWSMQKRRVSDLIPNEKNPRTMSLKQIEDLKKSLKKFNLVEIPVIDTENKVIAGHQRLMVLKLLERGDEKIEVRVPNRKLTKQEYDQYLLASNRVHGDWDWDKLAENFEVDMLLASGFDDTDLSHLFDDLEVEDDEFDVDKAVESIRKPTVKTGDLFQLGRHRLLCSDSTDPKSVQTLMGGKKAQVILQDPPFNVGLSYDKGVGGKRHFGGEVDDNKTDAEYREFMHKALTNGLSVVEKDAHIFTYCDQKYIWLLQTLYQELKVKNQRVCLWLKNNSTPTPQVAFNRQFEPCIYGTIGKPYLSDKVLNVSEIMNAEVGTGNRTLEDVLDMIDIWLVKRLNSQDMTHPTAKPPKLHERALRRCSKPGDIILDCFGGSGSLMVTAEQLQRSAYLIEQSPVFAEVIINRYEKFSGQKAKKLN